MIYVHTVQLKMIANISAPCSAGDYMTDSGCQQCEENTYSTDGASSCTNCPAGKVAAAGSTSAEDCYSSNGNIFIRNVSP